MFLILEKITEHLSLNQFSKSCLEITFYNLLKSDRIKLGPGLPILQSTLLAWIVPGPFLLECLEPKGLS